MGIQVRRALAAVRVVAAVVVFGLAFAAVAYGWGALLVSSAAAEAPGRELIVGPHVRCVERGATLVCDCTCDCGAG